MSQYIISTNYNTSSLYSSSSKALQLSATYQTNVYFVDTSGGVNEVYKIDISGTVSFVASNFGHNDTPTAMGISLDGTQLIIYTSKFQLFPIEIQRWEIITIDNPASVSPTPTVYTMGASFYFMNGNICQAPSGTYYGVGNQLSSDSYILSISISGGTATVSEDTLLTVGGTNYSCSNLFLLPLSDSNYFVTRVADSTNISSATIILYKITGGVFSTFLLSYQAGGNLTTALDSYFDVVAPSPTGEDLYFYLPTFESSSGNYVVYTYSYTIGGSPPSRVGSFTLPYDPTDGNSNVLYNMCASISGGTGLLRFYLVTRDAGGLYGVLKLYQTSGGSSTGGDPHIKMLNGNEIKFYDERRVLLLDTDPHQRRRERIKIHCDSLKIANIDSYDLRRYISEEQLKILFVNESYLNNIYVSFFDENGEKKASINTISLEIDGDEEVRDFFGEVEEISEEKRGDYKSNIFSPLKFEVIRKMRGEIKCDLTSLNIEIIRTKCIHLSDFHISISGEIDLEEFSGAIIDGKLEE